MQFFIGLLVCVKCSDILPLENFVRDLKGKGPESDAIIGEMSRSDSLFRLGDTRDLIFAMLHYRIAVLKMPISVIPIHLLQYGCQCQIMTDSSLGLAKDPLDEACVGWHQCRTCIKLSNSMEEDCDPMNKMYQIGVNITDNSLSCALTASECQKATCECDIHLVDGLIRNIGHFDPKRVMYRYNYRTECRNPNPKKKMEVDNFFKNPTEEFEASNEYVSKTGLVTNFRTDDHEHADQDEQRNRPIEMSKDANSPMSRLDNFQDDEDFSNPTIAFNHRANSYDMCCGKFPNVRPFNSNGGSRKCCGNSVYNWKTRDCCPHNVIAPIGSC